MICQYLKTSDSRVSVSTKLPNCLSQLAFFKDFISFLLSFISFLMRKAKCLSKNWNFLLI